MPRKLFILILVLTPIALAYVVGCDSSRPAGPSEPVVKANPTPAAVPAADGAHGHRQGAHGGNIVEIGRDNYHAEPVFEAGGTLRLYLLGQDEARVLEVEEQTITAYAKPEGGTEAVAVALRPNPQTGDAPGKTSRFVGALPKALAGRSMEVTVPSIRIAGERFRFAFASASPAHDEGMPDPLADADEKALYLKPAGKYTDADVKANGNQTAAEKFRGAKASHDLRPRPGDTICPVTLTKANPKFSWIVGGKTYLFCCPPCIDEFVTLAKEHPEQVREPAEYVKK